VQLISKNKAVFYLDPGFYPGFIRRIFSQHFYSVQRVSLQGSKGIPRAFFVTYPDRVSAVHATATCCIQIVFRPVAATAVDSSKDSVFAEDKLSGKVQILFKIFLNLFLVYLF
jgi:hypothetical protein